MKIEATVDGRPVEAELLEGDERVDPRLFSPEETVGPHATVGDALGPGMDMLADEHARAILLEIMRGRYPR